MRNAPPRVIAALVAAGSLAGCYHYTASIPGVLDTRSDGSSADASPPVVKDETLSRQGLSALVDGAGVQADGAHVRIEERHFFGGVTAALPGAFLLTNDSASEELKAALGDGALRDVRVGHSYTTFDVLLTLATGIVPCVPLLLAPQPYTFSASGERIAAGGTPPQNRPVAPPVDLKKQKTPAAKPEPGDEAEEADDEEAEEGAAPAEPPPAEKEPAAPATPQKAPAAKGGGAPTPPPSTPTPEGGSR